MNCKILNLAGIAVLATSSMAVAFGQGEPTLQTIDPSQLHVLNEQSAREAIAVTATLGDAVTETAPAAALPLWTYNVTASQDGNVYSGMIVGTSAIKATNTTTTVPTPLIPVILKITQGGVTYTFDPTQGDVGCLGSGNTAFSLTENSPLFKDAPFTFNGVNVGDTQYSDAFLRGEFWKHTAGTSYHLLLSVTPKTALTITVNAGTSGNSTAEVYSLSGTQCGNNAKINPHAKLAVVNINTMDSLLQNYITANGLNAAQFPFFVLYNSVMSIGNANNVNNCCVLGYHNALGNPGQTYGIAEFEGRDQTVFSATSDVSAGSHEINEWVNDPNGSNPTPAWGHIGQQSGCQNNFEVGDPLSGKLMPPVTLNGFTYHVQELAYFSWFYQATSIGAGGKFSSNGTFTTDATLCQ